MGMGKDHTTEQLQTTKTDCARLTGTRRAASLRHHDVCVYDYDRHPSGSRATVYMGKIAVT